jgi:hypothetical protein
LRPEFVATLRGMREQPVWLANRERETLARSGGKVFNEPMRSLRMGRDHDLVGGERRERIGDRLHGIGVPDAAAGMRSRPLQPVDAVCGPFPGSAPGSVLVRQPVPEAGIQCRRDDEDLGVAYSQKSHPSRATIRTFMSPPSVDCRQGTTAG